MMLLMMLMLSRVNKVCVLLFLRVSFVRDFWGRRKHWEEKFISVAVKVNAYIFQRISNIRDARRFSHLLEAYLPPVSFVSYPCESPAKLSRLRI